MGHFDTARYRKAVQSMIDSESDLLFTSTIPENVLILLETFIRNAKTEVVIVCDRIIRHDLYSSPPIHWAIVDAARTGVQVTIHSNDKNVLFSKVCDVSMKPLVGKSKNLEYIVVDRKMFRVDNGNIKGTSCVNSDDLAENLLSLLQPVEKETNLLDIDYEWL